MRYPGGKGATYRRLISLMWAHDDYVETHLSGGAVIGHKKPASRNNGIEIDPVVLAQWPVERYPQKEFNMCSISSGFGARGNDASFQ